MENMTIDDLLSQVDSTKRPIAEQLVSELDFMAGVLEELKASVREHGATEQFKNGSQVFERQTPALQAYNTTITKYATLQKQFIDLLPEGEIESGDALDDFLKG